MAIPGTASPDERKNAIRSAVSYNLPCDLWLDADGYRIRGKSRFFGMSAGLEGSYVLVEAPVADGHIVPVRPGEFLDVYFRVDEQRYMYRATVLGRTEYQLPNRHIARALEITYPDRMTRGQKREFYRISVPLHSPLELTFGVMDANVTDPIAEPRTMYSHTADVRNLSGSGLAFELSDRLQLNIRQGHRLLCAFTLPTGEFIELQGNVVNILRIRGRGVIRCGVEYIDLDKAVAFRMAQDTMLRYIVSVQRDQMARRSGIRD